MNTIEHKGLTFRVDTMPDECSDFPWDREDGHGPVRQTRNREDKRAGERVLVNDRHAFWLYNEQEAMRIAKRDGWGISTEDRSRFLANTGREPTPNEVALAAVQADFQRLRGFLEGDWCYVGLVVTLLDVDGEPTGETESLWGIESDAGEYLDETARELAGEIAKRVGRKKYLETRVRVRS